MAVPMTETTPRRAALIAGAGYAALFLLAIFANFYVRTGLVEAGDAAATVANIIESEALFRAGLLAFLIIFVLDVVIAWALYVLFATVSRPVSLLAAWFRLVYTVFLGVAAIFLFGVLHLVGGSGYLNAFEPGQIDAQVMLLLEAFNYAWLIGLAAFGLHLVLLGYILLASGLASKVLGWLLTLAGAAYIVDTTAYGLLSNYADYEGLFLTMVAVPAVIAELGFTVWLLARAGRTTSDREGASMELPAVPDGEERRAGVPAAN